MHLNDLFLHEIFISNNKFISERFVLNYIKN